MPSVEGSQDKARRVPDALQVRLALEIIFEGVQGASDVGTVQGASAAGDVLRIADTLTLTHKPAAGQIASPSVILEWEGGPMGDMLADAITAVILQVRVSCSVCLADCGLSSREPG